MQTLSATAHVAEEKRRLRKELRTRRRALDASALARAADDLRAAAASYAPLADARTVAGYVACDGEIDVRPVLADAWRDGRTVVLPRRAAPGVLELAQSFADEVLEPSGPYGLSEPRGPAIDPATLPLPAVVLVPAVALDRQGRRLGRGGGDYDRLLPALRARGWTVVGACHALQLRDALPVEAHDQPVDAILTDAGLLLPSH